MDGAMSPESVGMLWIQIELVNKFRGNLYAVV